MTHSEALFFIGKCLTLDYYPDRVETIRAQIESGYTDWNQIVWVSTSHQVFPALYLNLKRAGLLPLLPLELVEYMEELTSNNRERNLQMIEQAHEISGLLNAHNISPVFLKGCGHMLDGLYRDIAERMMGDIDILVKDEDMVRAVAILTQTGYQSRTKMDPYYLARTKHFPRLFKEGCLAGVEVHRQILRFPDYEMLDNAMIMKEITRINVPGSSYVLSNGHQIIHNIFHYQMEHGGYYYANLSLRQCYDLFLLAQRENPLAIILKFGNFFGRMNTNLAAVNAALGNPECIPYQQTSKTKFYLIRMKLKLKSLWWSRLSFTSLFLSEKIFHYPKQVWLSIFSKGVRNSLLTRLSDLKWYQAHWETYRRAFGKK